jgi:natural product biosynthesis luciferase-like monooxygenase protein
MRYSLLFFSADGAGTGSDKYELLLHAARLIDDSALTAVWLPERHFAAFGGLYPNPSLPAAVVATQTNRIRIRSGSVILPLQDPLRVAEEWSVVDNLSNGRVELSFGSGWNVNDFVLAPQNYENRRDIMREGIDTVRRLWRGERVERVNGAGESVGIGTLPRPVQQELPVWLTAQSESSFVSAGRDGLPVLTNLNFNSPDVLSRNCSRYREQLGPDGRDRAEVALMVHTFVGESDETARAAVDGPLRDYLRSNLDLRAQFASGKGGDQTGPTDAQVAAIIDRGVNRILDWAGLIGGADSLVAKARHFADQGVDELACLIDFGTGPEETEKSILRLCDLAERTADN